MNHSNATHRRNSERLELLAKTGVVSDPRRHTIADLRDYKLKLPLIIAWAIMLSFSGGVWVLIALLFGWL